MKRPDGNIDMFVGIHGWKWTVQTMTDEGATITRILKKTAGVDEDMIPGKLKAKKGDFLIIMSDCET